VACLEILHAIDECVSNDPTARPYAIVGLCLSLCQGGRCSHWTGEGCRRLGLYNGKFGEWLCDQKNWCDVWTELHGRDQ